MSWLVKQLNKKQKGFTLIEMVVVLAIIAVLIAIAVPQVLRQINNAKKNADIANAKAIATAIQQWVAEGNTIGSTGSSTWKDINSTNIGTGFDISQYINGGLPKVKWNSSWNFYYQYDTTTGSAYFEVLKIGAGKDAANARELYPVPDPSYGQ